MKIFIFDTLLQEKRDLLCTNSLSIWLAWYCFVNVFHSTTLLIFKVLAIYYTEFIIVDLADEFVFFTRQSRNCNLAN